MSTKVLTAIVVVAATAALIIYDIVIVIEPTPGDTISEVVLAFVWGHPFVSFAWGVLTGHLFWPMRRAPDWELIALWGLIALGVILLILDLCGVLPEALPVWYVLPGVVAGHFMWAQPIRRKGLL